MKHKIVTLIIIALTATPFTTNAHSGRTDAQGGHYNRKTGEYHYHGTKASKTPQKEAVNETIGLPPISQKKAYINTASIKQNVVLIKKSHYDIYYDVSIKLARYTYHPLNVNMLQVKVKRTDDFREDLGVISSDRAKLHNYKGSGYDRGHLVPAGDMTFTKTAMSETFYLTNIVPQPPSHNRGIWRKLEARVRILVKKYKELAVYTGIYLDDDIEYLNNTKVQIPDGLWKVVVYDEDEFVAYLIPYDYDEGNINSYIVSVDDIEILTNIDFPLDEELESVKNNLL